MINVLIADDQALVRGALAALLGLEKDLTIVAEIGDGTALVDTARTSGANVALIDIEMPGLDGIAATAALHAAVPECAAIIVTTFGRPGYLKRAIEAGARGFLVKDTPPAALADAIRRVHSGYRAIDPDLAEQSLFLPENPLTNREIEICRAAVTGSSTAEIARTLHLSPGTVRNHLSTIITKTQARNHYEAVRTAEENGWL
ncbi:response regulator [Corynebacterium sp.]|uniref:response regulator transcription factor n=1 Tax=Corynebacterium sp. TaxID=1720 RepID=UPI0026DC62F9|nr:response regulator transcription factor [Corynebacterium sp.]MDO5076986.1 response regulator transcription factor [Corynebacterium sp.]